MAVIDLTELELKAGEEYLAALKSFGFDPDVLSWTMEMIGGAHEKRLANRR
jgi:hypothetical protein